MKSGPRFGCGPGEVHGALRAQRPPGGGFGACPSLARPPLRPHPTMAGVSRRGWRPCRLHGAREEAREARVSVLGCCCGTAEGGACGATPAGKAETPTQSGSGYPGGGLNEDPFVVPWWGSWAEPPWTVGLAEPASPRLQEWTTAAYNRSELLLQRRGCNWDDCGIQKPPERSRRLFVASQDAGEKSADTAARGTARRHSKPSVDSQAIVEAAFLACIPGAVCPTLSARVRHRRRCHGLR